MKPFPAAKAEMLPISDIVPYERNPRTHPEAQIALLARLMKSYGVDQPIVVDENNVILKGHGRRLAAIKAGFKKFPVVRHIGLSGHDKKAIRIADNQVALLSGWDDELLKMEIQELQTQGFDMPMLGFPDDELSGMFAEAPQLDRVLDEQERVYLNSAWKLCVADWAKILDGFREGHYLSGQFTRGALAVYFARAKLHGDDIPRGATLAYTGHRLFVNGDKAGSLSDFLHLDFDTAIDKTPNIESLQWFCGGRPNFDKLLACTLAFCGHRLPGDFPVDLARKLIDEFCVKPGARVLDPCHGWGGRALGYLLSKNAVFYQGFEVDAQTALGVGAMCDDLKPFYDKTKKINLTLCPYEDAKLDKASYDFALTSPPYFDTEKYDGDLSSWRRYKTFETWVDGFFKPLIDKTAAALKPGAVFALQIGNQKYPLEETAMQIMGAQNLHFVEKRHTEMINNYTGTDPDDGETILILRKGGKGKSIELPSTVAVKVSAAMARIAFTECGPACIEQNGCKGNCCKSPGKPGGCFVTVHPDEQKYVEKAGATVIDGMIVAPPGTKGCPFQKADGLCGVHGTKAQPFGCIASPFTLNKKGTLIIRQRYTVLPCHLGPGAKEPAYKVFRSSLVLIFGETETRRITAKLDSGSGDFTAQISRPVYNKLVSNDAVKRKHKAQIDQKKAPDTQTHVRG